MLFSAMLKDMIQKRSCRAVWFKDQVEFDSDDWRYVEEQIILNEGMGSDEVLVTVNDRGHEWEILIDYHLPDDSNSGSVSALDVTPLIREDLDIADQLL